MASSLSLCSFHFDFTYTVFENLIPDSRSCMYLTWQNQILILGLVIARGCLSVFSQLLDVAPVNARYCN